MAYAEKTSVSVVKTKADIYLPWYIYGCAYDECSKKM